MFDYSHAEGLIFDCDGTLLDTLGAWDEAERELFAQAGPLTPGQEDEIHSAPIEQAARILHECYGVLASAQDVLDHLDRYLVPYYAERAEPLPGAVELVRAAHGAGVPCAVVSSSPRRYLELGLGRAGILDCFAGLVSTDETKCSKQDFGIYERALEVLESRPGSTWAVDDAPYAIRVMHDFGLRTICVGPRTSPYADMNVATLLELI